MHKSLKNSLITTDLKPRMIIELFFKQENLKKESKNSKFFIMRTLLQKLKFCAEMIPIVMLVIFLQPNVFGQDCADAVGDCEITGCADTETIILDSSDPNVLTYDCDAAAGPSIEYRYDFPTTMSGTGVCSDNAYRIELVSYQFFQFGSPTGGNLLGTVVADESGIINSSHVFSDGPGRYCLLYNLFAQELDDDGNPVIDGLGNPVISNEPSACCKSEFYLQLEGSIACNDQVQVTMDVNCTATITLDMVLEGTDESTCFANYYSMTIDGFPNNADGSITIDDPGLYNATVITPTGEQCWGSVLVEDKVNALLLDCEDFEVFCNQDYSPGAPVLDYIEADGVDDMGDDVYVNSSDIAINSICGDVAMDATTPDTTSIYFDFTTVSANQTVNKISEIALTISTPSVNSIKACLVSPKGKVVHILDLVTGNFCSDSDINIVLSEDAFMTHNNLTSAANCGAGASHAYCGDFQPLTNFSAFAGDTLNVDGGIWELQIKNYSTTEVACIEEAKIEVITNNGIIEYPFEGNATSTGPQSYEITLPDNNCGPYQVQYADEDIGPDCAAGTVTTIRRTWTVVSSSSGVETECYQDITITRWELSEIVMPPDYNGFDHQTISCDIFINPTDGTLNTSLLDDNLLPHPMVTGHPETPFGDIDLCTNYAYTYSDQKLAICGELSYKVLRDWSILDWCSGSTFPTYTQIIKVIDNQPPVIVAPEDGLEIETNNGFDCTADWNVVPPITVFDCGFALNPGSYTFTVGYLLADDNGDPPVDGEYEEVINVFDDNGDGNPDRITGLPYGRSWIRYTVIDDCDNIGYAFTEVDVTDVTAPNPVCVEFLVLSLGSDGCAHAGADSFDKGSWDNCGIDYFEVRRLDIVDDFGPYVNYCCTDLSDEEKLVELIVYDLDGNTNTCIVEVELQNPFLLVWNTTADPSYSFDCTEWDNPPGGDTYLPLFSASQNLSTIDCPWTITFDGPKIVRDLDDCGNGSYEIIYTASNGFSDDISYTVSLNYSNTDPFDPDNDVSWPQALFDNVDGCPDEVTLDPETGIFGSPTVNDNPCGLIAQTYEDQVFDDVENACVKILRTWTVIDWCTYDPAFPNLEVASFVQVIKVNDNDLPEFNCSVNPSIIFGEETSCNLNTSSLDTTGILILDMTEGFDACSEALNRDYDIEYEIDYQRDGTVDASGTGRNANGLHEYGQHSITWTIIDHCGNINSCTYNFSIQDSKPPTPYCLAEVVTVTMPLGTGDIEVWANDFDLGSYDNVTGNVACNNTNELVFTLVNVGTGETSGPDGVLTFNCADIPNGISQEVTLEMHVADEFGNSDFCTVTLILQDNENDACEDDSASRTIVAGSVYTEESEMLEEAMVHLSNNADYNTQMMTPNTGSYSFDNVPMGDDYEIVSEKDDNALNGVSTLDLVLIQKHILSILELPSPYKIIAADANRSGTVSAIDLIILRKIILGISDSFPNDEMPWRFIDADYTFADVTNPFPYQESINIDNLTTEMNDNNFIAVKIGDVNSTAVLSTANDTPITRSNNTVDFVVDNASFTTGDRVEIPVTSANFNNILGTQFTIKLDTDMVDFEGVTSGELNVEDNNFGYTYLSDGYITASWNESKAISTNDADVLFTINLIANENGNVANALNINSDITTAEAYNTGLEIMDVQLSINGQSEIEGYELYQNVPNPFGNETTIGFSVPTDGPVVLKIFDVNGKLVKMIAQDYNRGMNSIVLSIEDLKAKGIFYYTMEAEGYSATKKMIVLE